VHLVPRFPQDGHGEFVNGKNVKTIPMREMKTIAASIRQRITSTPKQTA